MNAFRLLPLALAAGLVVGCGNSESNASGTNNGGDGAGSGLGAVAGDVMKKAQGALGDLSKLELGDITKMDTTKLQELAKSSMDSVVGKLGEVKDLASAENVKSVVGPLVDKLGAMKTALGGKLPNMEDLKAKIGSLTSSFTNNSEVMNVLKPLLDKLSNLVG